MDMLPPAFPHALPPAFGWRGSQLSVGENLKLMRAFRLPLRALFTAATLILLATAGRAANAENLVTCDELPPQPADGLHVNGVTFWSGISRGELSIQEQLTTSYYGGQGPGLGAYVQDPSLITYNFNNFFGQSELMMEFDTPTQNLQFGVALPSDETLAEGATVELYDAEWQPIGSFPVQVSPVFSSAEGLFNYSGPAAKYAIVYSDPQQFAFAVDNIRFGTLVPRTQASGQGITAVGSTRVTSVLNARATALGRGNGSLYLFSTGNYRGTLRTTQINTLMLFGNRAVLTGNAIVPGLGTVRFAAEIIDGGSRRGADRISVAFYNDSGGDEIGPLPVTTGDFRVR